MSSPVGSSNPCAVADDQRGVLRAEEPGAEGGRAEEPLRGDADEVRQVGRRVAELLGRRASRASGTGSAPCGRLAGPQQVRGPAVVALLRGHRRGRRRGWSPCLASFGRCSPILQAGGGGGDLLERPAVGVAGLQVAQCRSWLGPPFIHSRMHDRFRLRVVVGGGLGEPAEPAGRRTRAGADGADAEEDGGESQGMRRRRSRGHESVRSGVECSELSVPWSHRAARRCRARVGRPARPRSQSRSVVEQELGAVQQHPEHVGQRLLLVAGRAAAVDVAGELLPLLRRSAGGSARPGTAPRPAARCPGTGRRRPPPAPRCGRGSSGRPTSWPFIIISACRIDVCVSVGFARRRRTGCGTGSAGRSVAERRRTAGSAVRRFCGTRSRPGSCRRSGRRSAPSGSSGRTAAGRPASGASAGWSAGTPCCAVIARIRTRLSNLAGGERPGQLVEQLRVARRVVVARLVHRVDEPDAEEVRPHPVGQVAGEERVVRGGQPVGQLLPRGAVGGPVRAGCRRRTARSTVLVGVRDGRAGSARTAAAAGRRSSAATGGSGVNSPKNAANSQNCSWVYGANGWSWHWAHSSFTPRNSRLTVAPGSPA